MKPEQMIEKTERMLKNIEIAKKLHVVVGITKESATGKVYESGANVLTIGTTHEFGGTIQHPGGTPYIIGKDKKTKFVSFNRSGRVAGFTKAHGIIIPQRSFLRVPFKIKSGDISKYTGKLFEQVLVRGTDPKKQLEKLGVFLQNISKKSFETKGYGTWPDIKAATKRRKGSSGILLDTGMLRNSITYDVRSD